MKALGWAPWGALVAFGLLVGCLPRQAVSRRDDLAALRYRVEVGLSTAEGFGLPAWSWRASGEAVVAFSRTFRDGTLGRAVFFEGMVDDAGAPVWDRSVVELRAFPSGEIVAVDGLAPFTGTAGHLELVDVLWPAFSPRVPDGPRGEPVSGVTSWPILFPTLPGVRLRVEGAWTQREPDVVWGGVLSGESAVVRVDGRVDGRYTRAEGRVTAASVDSARTITTRWAGGAQHVQVVVTSVSLQLVGDAVAPVLTTVLVDGDAASDASPLAYADGRAVSPGAASGAVLPFLGVTDATAAVVRGTLGTAGGSP